jgi:hypothetical protein
MAHAMKSLTRVSDRHKKTPRLSAGGQEVRERREGLGGENHQEGDDGS